MLLIRGRPCAAQALVEFALVLPLLIAVSLGALQLVLYAHARDVMTSSVEDGARLAAEDGRALAEGQNRTLALLTAGLGNSVDGLQIDASTDADVVHIGVGGTLRPILPLPLPFGLPLHADASVARERFRPGGR